MEISKVFDELDILLKQKKLKEAEQLLLERLTQAITEGDSSSVLAIMSELIGLYRVTGRHDESTMLADKSISLAINSGMENTEGFATILINSATAYRAAGKYETAMQLFIQAEEQLRIVGCKEQYRFASLYNNLSLLYQELEQYQEALKYLHKALDIIEKLENCEIEAATTYTNIALMQLKLNKLDEAENYLGRALNIFEADRGEVYKDSHYGAALAAMGDLYCARNSLDSAALMYQRAMRELELCYGRNTTYELIRDKYIAVYNKLKPAKGLELSKKYYEEYGKRMLHEKFPEYEDRIAVGLCGYGSECFGLDDALSADHDFGPAFCMWLTDEDYDAIGERLQEEYNKLPKSFLGYAPRREMSKGKNRVGVLKISEFYQGIVGRVQPPDECDEEAWHELDEEALAAVTNGAVFRDDLGIFTRLRDGYSRYYPEKIRLIKLAKEAALIAQTGQYNYERCLKRGDDIAALTAFSSFINHTLKFIFLLEKKYMPYYKLSYRAFEKMLEAGRDRQELLLVARKLKKLAKADYHNIDNNLPVIEEICVALAGLLNKHNLTREEESYMEKQADSIISELNKQELVKDIVKAEWEMFQNTRNEGGRAGCQNNFPTFNIMRSSQFMAWNDELLSSYYEDLLAGRAQGRNLITEKYGRMMESTAPEQYLEIKDNFPELSKERMQIAEQIIGIQVGWLEEFKEKYPKLSKQIRYIHTYEDTPNDTSAETYLRGELATYSEKTFILYGRYVLKLSGEGKNLNMMIMENTVHLYGYDSLEDAEERM